MDQEMRLEPADIILTRGPGMLSRIIRLITRSLGEPRTQVNHVGVVVVGGTIQDAVVVEALSSVKRHTIAERYGGSGDLVAVYRPIELDETQKRSIVQAAEQYVGRSYGYFKALLHVLDWFFLGVYLFRRLGWMDRYPICSWLVAHAYKRAGLNFGVDEGQATPDDIWDFVTSGKKRFWKIRGLWTVESAAPEVTGSLEAEGVW